MVIKKVSVKKKTSTSKSASITPAFIEQICGRLADGHRVRRTLPDSGRLHIDRQLPFLCVYRQPGQRDDPGTAELVMGEAAYLIVSAKAGMHKSTTALVTAICTTMKEAFGSFLLVEIWTMTAEATAVVGDGNTTAPTFEINLPKQHQLGATVEAFERALAGAHSGAKTRVEVDSVLVNRPCPPGLPSLIQPGVAAKLGCHVMGIAVRPDFRESESGQLFPLQHKLLRRRLAGACKRGFFDFTRRHTTHRPAHYNALGPRAMVKAVWTVDQQLARINNTFDLLLAVTPTNSDQAWSKFKRDHFAKPPRFAYHPVPIDPSLLKRELFKIPIERIEDPVLADLFTQQQQELDRKISLLADRGTRRFIYGSLQLFGRVDDELLQVAQEILAQVPLKGRKKQGESLVDAQAFAARASDEINYMKLTHPDIPSKVIIRKDIVGLMVSSGNMLIGHRLRMPATRVPAAIAHEVGTHILTYLNGRAQPFRQLDSGLPGYDALQEGLAVLAEYLVDGLKMSRLRLLAARVVAVHHMVNGASFPEVFHELEKTHGFTQRTSFTVAMRIFRGGGLTKDAVYLKGLLLLIQYLRDGGQLDPLFVGKFGLEHVPIIKELQLRHVLGPSPLRPTYLDDAGVQERLQRVRSGASLVDLVNGKKS